ncbi:MAG: hypothetical protein R8J41_11055 [Alphaproteobacteria bacterium]|uniref:hypothetical protein n=1 Tax=Pyruvatibacter mobilis TaxID=1712261 RepID=UPI0029685440|nr:hypothetical protein [Alphaproteobacteria bacterium]
MSKPYYIAIPEACDVLEEIGVKLSERQIKRAAEPDASGNRKLPFFVDPIDGRLKIDKNTLISIYLQRQVAAENSMTLSIN